MSEPVIPAVWRCEGERFVPSESAPGPWNPQHLHGGPSCGLLAPAFINTDTTLYLVREPEGEWIGMAADYADADEGVGIVEVVHYDHKGRYGRSVQARLAMSAPPGGKR
jgi:hypothetical protein